MKKLTSLAAILLAGCTTVSIPSESPRLLTQPERLTVNTNLPHYAQTKSQLEGERELVRLAFDAETEEAWLFDAQSRTWLEYGVDERPTGCRFDRMALGDMGGIIPYHLHPLSKTYLQTELKSIQERHDASRRLFAFLSGMSKTPVTITQPSLEDALQRACLRLGVPSAPDVHSQVPFYGEERIASPYGIVDFMILPKSGAKRHAAAEEYKTFITKDMERELELSYAMARCHVFGNRDETTLKLFYQLQNQRFKDKIAFRYRPVKPAE